MADDWLTQYPLAAPLPPDAGTQQGSGNDWLQNHPTVGPAPPGSFVPGQDNILANAPYDATDVAAHSLSFGLTDPIRATMHAGTDWLATQLGLNEPGTQTPMTRGFDYQNRAEEIARGRRQYEQENPALSTGASIAGSLAFAPASVANMAYKAGTAPSLTSLLNPSNLGRTFGGVAPQAPELTAAAADATAPSLWRQLGASVGIGTGGAAITGAADNPEHPGMGALSQAPYGAIGGALAPVISRVGSALGSAYRNIAHPDQQATANATDKLNSLIQGDIKTGSIPLQAADQRLADTQAPLSLAEIYPSVRKYLGTLYDRWTPAANNIFNQLNQRDFATGGRLLDTTDKTLAAGPENFLADQHLTNAQKLAAKPAYDRAYAAPPVNPDHLEPGGALADLLSRDIVKKGMAQAQVNVSNRGGGANSLGITYNAAGDPVFQRVPSWQTLDHVKQGIDNAINASYPRNPVTNKLQLDSGGSDALTALKDFTAYMDANNPHYADARAAYSGPQGSKRALEEGFAFRDYTPAEQAHMMSTFAPGDQQFYQLGAANRLRWDINRTVDSGDEAKKLINSPMMRDQLRPLFNSDAEYNEFLSHAADEKQVFQTGLDITGNSASARRLGAMAAEAPASSSSLAIPATVMALPGGVGHAATVGGLVAGGHQFGDWWKGVNQLRQGVSPEAQNAAAGMAMAPGQAGRQVIGLLQSPKDRLLAPTWLPGTMMGTNPATAGTALKTLEPMVRGLISPMSYRWGGQPQQQ